MAGAGMSGGAGTACSNGSWDAGGDGGDWGHVCAVCTHVACGVCMWLRGRRGAHVSLLCLWDRIVWAASKQG
jgi:hypothetical protein